MLEGEEYKGNIGDHGKYVVDIDNAFVLKLSAEINLMAVAKDILSKSSFGAKVFGFVDKVLGVKKQEEVAQGSEDQDAEQKNDQQFA